MLSYERPKIKTYEVGDVRKYAQLKRDGIMVTLICDGESPMRALTRHPDGAHDIIEQILDLEPIKKVWPRSMQTALMCELYSPGEPASQVKSYLASGDMSRLAIECFAIPARNEDWSLEMCKAHCDELWNFPFVEFRTWQNIAGGITDPEAVMREAYWWFDSQQNICGGYEGLVLKDGNLLNWCKWKPILTADLVILGFKDGRGKFLGTLGALELGLHDGTYVCSCGGMDDATRDLISENEDEYLGSVVEVSYQRKDSGGGLRHPRFKCLRPDKTREECTEI